MTLPKLKVTPSALLVMAADYMAEHRDEWLEMRRGHDDVPGFYCIGSSDTAGILGIAFGAERSGTPVRTWLEKVRGLQQPTNPAMTWGHLHENTIAEYWRMRNRSVDAPIGLIGNVDQPWHQTSLDRLIHECPLDRRERSACALEIKTRNAFGMRKWHSELPDDVLAQMAHQIFVSGFDHLHYAVLVGGSNYHQGVVRRQDIEDVITYVIDKCNLFRNEYLQYGNEVEPPWDPNMAAQSYLDIDAMKYPDRQGVTDADFEAVDHVMDLALTRAKKGKYTRLEKEGKARLAQYAEGGRVVTASGNLLYEYEPRSRIKINAERLAEKYPDAWKDPEVVTTTTSWQLKLADEFKVTTDPEDDE